MKHFCRRGVGVMLLPALLATMVLVGCGDQTSPESSTGIERTENQHQFPPISDSLEVTTDGWKGVGTASLVTAQMRDYFLDVGLKVGVLSPASPSYPIRYVVEEVDDVGVTQEPQLVMAREKGAPVVAIGSLVTKPTAAMIWLKKSQIGDIGDLKGKTIAYPGLPFQKGFLQSILAQAGLTLGDVKLKAVGYNLVSALVAGRADAIFGGSWNQEGIELEMQGLEPVVTRVQDFGVPAYDELVVIARSDRVSEDPQLIKKFISALNRGTATVLKTPRVAEEVLEESSEVNPALSPKVTKAELRATLPLLSKNGSIDRDQAGRLIDWMYEQGLIKKKPPVSELLANSH
jgi:putative hydroxymethylpyrimidine transport system substrate-binding protein